MNTLLEPTIEKMYPLWQELLLLPEDDVVTVSPEILAKLIRYTLYKDVITKMLLDRPVDMQEVARQYDTYKNALNEVFANGAIRAGTPVAVECIPRGYSQLFGLKTSYKQNILSDKFIGWAKIYYVAGDG